MKVLITLTPTHLSKFSLLPIVAVSAISNLGTVVESAASVLDDPKNSLGNVSSALFNNAFVFADLQANVVSTSLERNIVRHSIPGREGFVLQDLGGNSTEITVTGKWIYENSGDDSIAKIFNQLTSILGSSVGWNWMRMEMMKTLARINIPLMLATDLFVGPVLIEKVDFKYIGGSPNVYDYSLKFIEWNPKLSIVGTIALTTYQAAIGAVGQITQIEALSGLKRGT